MRCNLRGPLSPSGSIADLLAFHVVCATRRSNPNSSATRGAPVANPQHVYHMHKLSKTYPGGKQVLKEISLSFFPGAKIGVVGLNGSGKSTLLKIMAGELYGFLGGAGVLDRVRDRV